MITSDNIILTTIIVLTLFSVYMALIAIPRLSRKNKKKK